MITLKELINQYPFLKDYEIIKKFFRDNHIEEQAIALLTQLSQEMLTDYKNYIWRYKEYCAYGSSIFVNKLKEKDKIILWSKYNDFLIRGQLTEDALNDVKQIIENNEIIAIPQLFLAYLQANNVGKNLPDASEFHSELIENPLI